MRWGRKKDTQRYVIVKVAKHGGLPLAYFTLDYRKAWKWTRHTHKASIFLCPKYADTVIRQTSADWEALWEIRPFSI
jgi:hypothetical protein